MSSTLGRAIQTAMSRQAQATSAFIGGTIKEEASPGRWVVTLDRGGEVTVDVKNPCMTPLVGAKWDLSRQGNRLQLDSPSGFG